MAKKIQALGSPDKNIERSLAHLYDRVNEVIQAINQGYEGTPGDNQLIRINTNAENLPVLEIKTNKGWAVSDPTSLTGFKIKE